MELGPKKEFTIYCEKLFSHRTNHCLSIKSPHLHRLLFRFIRHVIVILEVLNFVYLMIAYTCFYLRDDFTPLVSTNITNIALMDLNF